MKKSVDTNSKRKKRIVRKNEWRRKKEKVSKRNPVFGRSMANQSLHKIISCCILWAMRISYDQHNRCITIGEKNWRFYGMHTNRETSLNLDGPFQISPPFLRFAHAFAIVARQWRKKRSIFRVISANWSDWHSKTLKLYAFDSPCCTYKSYNGT